MKNLVLFFLIVAAFTTFVYGVSYLFKKHAVFTGTDLIEQRSNSTTFPNTQETKFKKTSKMLDENVFWNIIDISLKKSNNKNTQEAVLISELEKLKPEDIVGFRLRTDKLLSESYNSEIWCAGYLINGGCSDDCFEYFRLWLISRGRLVFEETKKNPDYLSKIVKPGMEPFEFEEFWAVAIVAFKNVTGNNLYDYIDFETFSAREALYPRFNFTWSEDNPESMKKICPNLFNMFQHKVY